MAVDKNRFISKNEITMESSGDIGSSAISVEGSNKHLLLYKQGNIVNIALNVVLTNSLAGNNALIATIPEKFRPKSSQDLTSFSTYNNSYIAATARITSSGEVKTGTGSGTFTGSYRVQDSYFI